MGNIVADIKNGIIFDGAMGTMLIDAGLAGGKPSEAWVIERPEQIRNKSVITDTSERSSNRISSPFFSSRMSTVAWARSK